MHLRLFISNKYPLELYSFLHGDMTLPTYFSKVPNHDKDDSESRETTIDLGDDEILLMTDLSLVHP